MHVRIIIDNCTLIRELVVTAAPSIIWHKDNHYLLQHSGRKSSSSTGVGFIERTIHVCILYFGVTFSLNHLPLILFPVGRINFRLSHLKVFT